MKRIILRVESDTDEGWYASQTLFANDEKIASVTDLTGCQEDGTIGRDLVDCNDIKDWIKYGYDAAKRGDELIFE